MNILIIVDFQIDFCQKKGALYVDGAGKALRQILKLLNSRTVDKVFFTVDWHPVDHCSFTENGGHWPMHCVQYSTGASIPDVLIGTCQKNRIPFEVIRTGADPKTEAYSAFAHLEDKGNYVTLTSDRAKFHFYKRDTLIVCGLAGDYCVYESVKDLSVFLRPAVFGKGIAYIADQTKLGNLMQEKGLEEVK